MRADFNQFDFEDDFQFRLLGDGSGNWQADWSNEIREYCEAFGGWRLEGIFQKDGEWYAFMRKTRYGAVDES